MSILNFQSKFLDSIKNLTTRIVNPVASLSSFNIDEKTHLELVEFFKKVDNKKKINVSYDGL